MTNQIKTGYKQTEVGVIPEDWEVKKFNELFSITAGGDLDKNNFSLIQDEKYSFPIYSNSLSDKGLYGYTSEPTQKENTITVTARGTVGFANARNHEYSAIGRVLILTPLVKTNCFFMAEQINNRLSFANESTGVPQLTAPQISTYDIALPPLSEQTAIAAALSDVDTLMGELDKLIAKKRDIKQATMQQLLTGKKRLAGFSGEWEVKRLGELLDYEQPTKYLVSSTEYNDHNNVAVLTAGKSFVLGYTNEEHGIFQNLPVIIFDDFTTTSKYVDFPFKVKSSAMKMLKPKNEQVNLKFLFEKIQTIRFLLNDHKRYWISEYQKLEIELPTIEEQTAIATILSDMDAEINALQQKHDKTAQLKQGMMQELLTGRIRLIGGNA